MPRRPSWEVVSDLLARAVVVVLFSMLLRNLWADFLKTGRVTGLLLVASESLVVALTIMRRQSTLVHRSFGSGLVTALSLAGPPLFRPADSLGLVPDAATAVLSTAGLALVIVGKIALGRSFGIAPANRGVVATGPYLVMRHPIYTGYLISHAAFLIANPSWWNLIVILVSDWALVVRALIEERVLGQDTKYQSYCERVAWHLVPGVF
jgi:hypothetical protein